MRQTILAVLTIIGLIGCSSSGSSGPTDPPSSPDPPPPPESQTVFSYESADGDYAVFLPPGISRFRGVILVGPGAREDTRLIAGREFDFEGFWDDPTFQAARAQILAVAEEHELAVMGARLPDAAWRSLDPLENLLTALSALADESDHPELAQAPLLIDGYSAGGCFGYAFTLRHPERVIGFWTHKGGCHDDWGAGAARQVPGFLIIGGADTESRCLNLTGLFESNRPSGALWALAVEPGAGHERMLDFDLTFDWTDAVLEQRLPEVVAPGAPVVLRPIAEQSGWLGNRETAAIAPFGEYEGDKAQASWLPSAQAAERWSAFVSPGRALGCPEDEL